MEHDRQDHRDVHLGQFSRSPETEGSDDCDGAATLIDDPDPGASTNLTDPLPVVPFDRNAPTRCATKRAPNALELEHCAGRCVHIARLRNQRSISDAGMCRRTDPLQLDLMSAEFERLHRGESRPLDSHPIGSSAL